MKIAIIGAGITGLSAAKKLHASGINTTVFDKARGKGGRLTTKKLDMGAINIGAQYFTAKDPRFVKQTQKWVTNNVAARWEFSPYKIHNNTLTASPDNRKRYAGCNGMRSLTNDLASDIKIIKSTRIEHITTAHQLHTLTDANNNQFGGFDWVISTLPAEQAKVLFTQHDHITSNISENVHRPCCAVTIATQGQIDASIQGIFGDSTVAWVSRLSAQPGWTKPDNAAFDDIWEIHFTPDWSDLHANDDTSTIVQTAKMWLENITQTELHLKDSYYHFWKYANLTNKEDRHQPVIDKKNKLAVTGAWCFGGRVEGGFLAGENIADILLAKEQQ